MNSSDGLFCQVCKIQNVPGALECAFCSAPLITGEPERPTTLGVSETLAEGIPNWANVQIDSGSSTKILLLVDHSADPLSVEPGEPFILGRNLEKLKGNKGESIIDLSPFEAYDKGVSRRHALVQPAGSEYLITDLDSTNGTWVNQHRIIPGRFYPLEMNSEIRLGHLLLRLILPVLNNPADILGPENSS